MATANIIKGDNIKLEGRFHLDARQAAPRPQKTQNAPSVSAEVRIVENHPEFAVIELTCSCGKKTFLRCNYAVGQTPEEQGTEQTK